MSTRTKSILIYVGGIVTGIILTFTFFFFVALGNANGTPSDENVVLFEKPNVPTGKRVMQIGTYKYITRSEMGKTVPIVKIMD